MVSMARSGMKIHKLYAQKATWRRVVDPSTKVLFVIVLNSTLYSSAWLPRAYSIGLDGLLRLACGDVLL